LDTYLSQGGPGGAAGKSEMFAEGFAELMVDRAAAVKRFDEEFIKFIEEMIKP